MPNNIKVIYDGVKVVEVVAPAEFTGRTCGICGNFNHKTDDDLTLGPHVKDGAGVADLCPTLAPTGSPGDLVGEMAMRSF
jgi:hypothetical protein